MIGLCMIVRNEEAMIEPCLASVKPYISHWTIVDTGSTDDTKKIVRQVLKGVPGKLHEREFVNFGHNRTEALALARGKSDWILEPDADMTATFHEGLMDWLSADPDPNVLAWSVEIVDSGTVWRLPRLMRGDYEWRYVGAAHEYLDCPHDRRRSLLGLTLTHHGSNRHPIQKFDHYLQLLKTDLDAGDPRATFYSAECLRFLGCIPAAVELYERRAQMNGFEEEAWYAQYMAAKLSRSVTDLLKAFERRPHRAEPLWAAADLVRSMESDDLLFREMR